MTSLLFFQSNSKASLLRRRSFGSSRNLSSREEPKERLRERLHSIESERTRRGGKGDFFFGGGGWGNASCEET